MLRQQPDHPSSVLIERRLLKIDGIDNWKENLEDIQGKLDSSVFFLLKELPKPERKRMIIRLEPYVEKFFLLFKDSSARAFSIYAWLLEMKLKFCNADEYRLNLKKIEEIYKQFSKKHPHDGWWSIRINYLCFSSKFLNSDETIKLALSYLDFEIHTGKHKPSDKQISQILVVLAIEHEKQGLINKYRDYAYQALHYDPEHAVTYSLLGKYYYEEGNNFYNQKKFSQGKASMERSREFYEIARELDPQRFENNHGSLQPSSTKLILCDLLEKETTLNVNSTPNVNLKETCWPVLCSDVQKNLNHQRMRKEFEDKFSLPNISTVNYETWEKENAALLAQEPTRYVIVHCPEKPKTTGLENPDLLSEASTRSVTITPSGEPAPAHLASFLSKDKLRADASEFIPRYLRP